MGKYANIKSKKFKKKILKWLDSKDDIEITKGGRHNIKVACIHTGESYPIPCSHKEINKNIISDFVKWLEENNICEQEEFDNRL